MKSVYHDPAYAGVAKELAAEVKRLQEVYEVPTDTEAIPKNPLSLSPNVRKQQRGKKK